MIVSGGALLSLGTDSAPRGARWFSSMSSAIGSTLYQNASYSEMYLRHNWVFTVVDYLAHAHARLPLKVYRRTTDGRDEERDSAYARLLRRPNSRMDRNLFWRTMSADFDLYGEAIAFKVYDPETNEPAELWPVDPSYCDIYADADGAAVYDVRTRTGRALFTAAEVVHIRSYNPLNPLRGTSPLEPLRRTLENEDHSRQAQSSFWQRGARPGTALVHPGNMSQQAMDRLKIQFDALAAGSSNTGATIVFEEGMKPETLGLSAEEAQYIQGRELNAVEVIGAYHLPPTAVGILTHATFSNVTEQLRSVYRDTVAPRLAMIEAALDSQLRPDFDPAGDTYAEFLLDEVLRGSFEDRQQALATGINAGVLTRAEAREIENRPFIEGSDQLLTNAANVPLISGVDDDPDRALLIELVKAAPSLAPIILPLLGIAFDQAALAPPPPLALARQTGALEQSVRACLDEQRRSLLRNVERAARHPNRPSPGVERDYLLRLADRHLPERRDLAHELLDRVTAELPVVITVEAVEAAFAKVAADAAAIADREAA